MNVKDAIQQRRSYRALAPAEITQELIHELADSAGLAPSCMNKQPWRFVFVYEQKALAYLQDSLAAGNAWAKDASLLIAVCSSQDLDCVTPDTAYYMFDTGMACAQMMLRATELGLVTHPMAGFSEQKAKQALQVPDDMKVITLIAVGTHDPDYMVKLEGKKLEAEEQRPPRMDQKEFAFLNRYPG